MTRARILADYVSGGTTAAEFDYLDGVTSNVQTQLDAKVSNATHTGDVTGGTALTIATDAVDIAMLSATGTASATTFLRGDNAWAAAGGSTQVEHVYPLIKHASSPIASGDYASSPNFYSGGTVVCTGAVPTNFVSLDELWLWVATDEVGAVGLTGHWSAAQSGTSRTTHQVGGTSENINGGASLAAGNAYRYTLLDLEGSGNFEDTITAGDIFGWRIVVTAGDTQDTYGLCIQAVWTVS
jgi:hypothetical protein